MIDVDDEEEASTLTVRIQFAENGHVDDKNVSLLVSAAEEDIEQRFMLIAFLHSRNIDESEVMSAQMDGNDEKKGITLLLTGFGMTRVQTAHTLSV